MSLRVSGFFSTEDRRENEPQVCVPHLANTAVANFAQEHREHAERDNFRNAAPSSGDLSPRSAKSSSGFGKHQHSLSTTDASLGVKVADYCFHSTGLPLSVLPKLACRTQLAPHTTLKLSSKFGAPQMGGNSG